MNPEKPHTNNDTLSCTILVAEDEPVTRMALEHHLNNNGYRVHTAVDGREALRLLEQTLPDLIITDIMMPFTSGLELVGIVRSTQQQHIPVIVLSAIDEEATVMEAFSLGADDFITKPFAPNELSIRVKRLLNQYRKSTHTSPLS
jgi:DNA-binding response OmpR family regulator